MTNEMRKTPGLPLWKGLAGLMASVLISLAIILWLAFRSDSDVEKRPILPSIHPLFGQIYETTAVLGPVVHVPNGSSTRARAPLALGPNLMTWLEEELHGGRAGCLYTWDPLMMNSNVWSFAPCAKSKLAQVTKADLQASFCSADDDAKGRSIFGSKWVRSGGRGPRSTAIWVREGEVVLAKHVRRPSVIYVLEMTRQEQYVLHVRYVEVSQ